MFTLRAFVTSLLILLTSGMAWSQTSLTGVINTYYEVTAITGVGKLEVTTSAGLMEGDTVLLIQMQGAEIHTAQDDTFGVVNNFNGAGDHEWAVVCEVLGNTIVFEKEFYHDYDAAGHMQIVDIPRYASASVDGTLTCQPWNGSTGGVLIFEVGGTLTLNATVEVSNRGFRGGQHDESTYNCLFIDSYDDYSYELNTGLGAQKGEGIANYTTLHEAGRGPNANGGGGGNDHNSGGGGGSNAAGGGQGGENDEPGGFNCDGYFPGFGGRGMAYSTERIFMGGGGGAGHSNSQWNSSGGAGGGIVIITAGTLNGNGQDIRSEGQIGENGFGDGSGGGGAAGTIILDVQNYSGSFNLVARGGDGGSSDGFTSNRCFGPGGGGAGGLVFFQGASQPVGATLFMNGGANGVVTNTTNGCVGANLNADPGGTGITDFNYVMPTGYKGNQECYYVPEITMDSLVIGCNGLSVTLDPGAIANGSYLWSTGETTQTISVNTPGTYVCTIDNGQWILCDSTIVNLGAPAAISLPGTVDLCIGDSILLEPGSDTLSYQWNTGATTSTLLVTSDGTYTVTVDNNGCITTQSTVATFYAEPDTLLADIIEICGSPTAILDAETSTATSYLWSTGETTPSIEVGAAGFYSVTITNGGCSLFEETEVQSCVDELIIPNTITPNGDGANDTWIIRGIETFANHTVQIYGRNGEMIYESTNYQNDWDGDGIPATTYYYLVDLGNGSETLGGTLTILRPR